MLRGRRKALGAVSRRSVSLRRFCHARRGRQPARNFDLPYGQSRSFRGYVDARGNGREHRSRLQLEWNALQHALESTSDSREQLIVDALTFRASRGAVFPNAAPREAALEIFEGLAEYTGARLANFTDVDVVRSAVERRSTSTGFVRIFAYVSGPLYGFLLDATGVDWRKRLTKETDLALLLSELTHLGPHGQGTRDAEEAEHRHGGEAIRLAERDIEAKRLARVFEWTQSLIVGPVLVVNLKEVTRRSFDPRRVFPLDEQQVVYTSRTLSASWGMLTVDDGAILENEATGRGHISLVGASADYTRGTGWSLHLAKGWAVAASARPGDFTVARIR